MPYNVFLTGNLVYLKEPKIPHVIYLLISSNFKKYIKINGNCHINIINGAISVNGAEFRSPKSLSVFSSQILSQVSFKNVVYDKTEKQNEELENILNSCNGIEDKLNLLVSTCLKVSSITNSAFEDICQYKNFNFLKCNIDNVCFEGCSFNFNVENSPEYVVTRQIENCVSSMKVNSNNPITSFLIYGHQNVGKSSFLRYLINSYFSKGYKSIYVLDCDPGQSEFCTSASICVVKITQPLFCAPFSNQLCGNFELIQQNFLSYVTPSQCFDLYCNSIKNLVNLILNILNNNTNSENLLFINTMGYMRGPGLKLLAYIIYLLNPSYLINLYTKTSDKFFIDKKFINEYYNDVEFELKSDLYLLESIVKKNKKILKPYQYRELMDLTYFHNILSKRERYPIYQDDYDNNPVTRLRCISPYKVRIVDKIDNVNLNDLACVKLKIIDNDNDEPVLLNEFYLKWVGLCQEMENGVWKCFGMALVSFVKLEEQELDLITGLNYNDLHGLTLVMAQFSPPNSLFPDSLQL